MKIDTIKSGGQSQGGLDNAGGTLSGPLMLSRDPQVPMEAATKRYVDTTLSNLSASNVVSGTLPIARLPAFSGDVTSEAGSNNVVLSNTGITVGEYRKIVVDAKGRATNGTGLGNSDIPNFNFSKITTDKPTTLAGYGITDGVSLTGGAMTGPLVLSGSPVSGDNLVPKQYIDGMVNSLSASKTGDVIRKSYATTPAGFLKCNGGEVSKTTYADLYAVIGESNNSYNVIGSGQPWHQQYEINNLQSVDIGPWTTETSLPAPLSRSQAIVTKNRVYLLGGNILNLFVNTVYTAPINSDGTIGTWSTGAALPIALGQAQAVVTKNRVYLLSGYNSVGTAITTTYTAPINTDGTLGAWTTGTSLPGGLCVSQAVVTKNRVYLLGGQTTYGTALSTVYTAPINTDGTLGAWTTGTSLPGGLCVSQAVVTKNRVYLLGGYNGTVYVSTVYTAPINNDGTLGTWVTGTSLPVALGWSNVIVTKNRVYLLGGCDTTTSLSTVYTAPINMDGTLGTWAVSTSLSNSITYSQVIVTKNKAYLLGGSNDGTNPISTVYAAPISGGLNDYSAYYIEDATNYMVAGSGKPWQQQYQINTTQTGDITGWTGTTALPAVFSHGQTIVTKNRVYLIAGSSGIWSNVTSTVYTAVINTDGSLGAWSTTTSLPVAFSHAQAVVTKNRVYVMGGYSATGPISTVYTAPINADGTLGTWVASANLPITLSSSVSFVTKNRVYLCGGFIDTLNLTSNVYSALINSDGTLGTWSLSGTIPEENSWKAAFVTKNRVYLCGGDNSAGYISSVFMASINSNGVIGPWVVSTPLPGPLYSSGVFVSKNTVYLIGGFNASGPSSIVYKANIFDNGTLSTWSTGTSIPVPCSIAHTIVTKNHIYITGFYDSTNGSRSEVYVANISEGLNDYSPYYDGTIVPVEPVNPTTTFKLPDMSATDVNGIYHYIKY